MTMIVLEVCVRGGDKAKTESQGSNNFQSSIDATKNRAKQFFLI